jgi:hypothetical protein
MRVWVVLCVAACGGRPTPTDVGSAPDIVGLDVLVSPTSVLAYVGFTDDWAANGPRFAQPGECATGETDAIQSGVSCFEHLDIDGIRLATDDPYGASNPYYGSGITTDATLRVVACGIAIEVPIQPGNYPAFTDVQAMQTGSDLVVNWAAPDAVSVLVGAGGGFGIYNCHETIETQHLFTGYGVPSAVVELRAFRVPEIVETAIGQVRVWYGEVTSPRVAMSAR